MWHNQSTKPFNPPARENATTSTKLLPPGQKHCFYCDRHQRRQEEKEEGKKKGENVRSLDSLLLTSSALDEPLMHSIALHKSTISVPSLILFIQLLFTLQCSVLCGNFFGWSELHRVVKDSIPYQNFHNFHEIDAISKLAELFIASHCVTYAAHSETFHQSLNLITLPHSTDALSCPLPSLKCTLFTRSVNCVHCVTFCNDVECARICILIQWRRGSGEGSY